MSIKKKINKNKNKDKKLITKLLTVRKALTSVYSDEKVGSSAVLLSACWPYSNVINSSSVPSLGR